MVVCFLLSGSFVEWFWGFKRWYGKIERMETGKLLRELRNYLKISVRDFSAMLGVVPTTIYWYENGGTLTESHIEYICQAFNVDKEYFKGTMTL